MRRPAQLALLCIVLPASVAAQTVDGAGEPGDWIALAEIALGFVLATAGLASLALSILKRRGSLPLSAFGLLALLYGASFLVASEPLQPLFGSSQQTLRFAAAFFYYVMPIPGLIYAEQVRGPGWHGILRRLWQAAVPLAVGFIAFDLITGTPFASFRVYGFFIIVVMSVLLPHVVLWRQPDSVESEARTAGTGALVLSIIHDSLVSFGALPWQLSLQIFGVAAFLLSLGFITLRRLLANQRELALVEQEMSMAMRIQNAILPHTVPRISGLDVSVRYVPSRFVAGDLYGFLPIDAHKLGIIVADVTGHGVPAALIASMTTAVFSSQIEHADDTGRLLSAMNRALAGRFDGQFVTAAYVFIDTERRRLKYSVAGHPPPLLHRRASGTLVPLSEAALVLGILPEVQYPTCESIFEPGDRLVLYTDGVSEARSTSGDWFGDDELVSFVRQGSDRSADRLTRELLARLEQWTGRSDPGPFEDDLTLIVVDGVDAAAADRPAADG